VPLLAVGDRALIGSFDIPDQLPAIVEDGSPPGAFRGPRSTVFGRPWSRLESRKLSRPRQ
jgi:hypothetical protein